MSRPHTRAATVARIICDPHDPGRRRVLVACPDCLRHHVLQMRIGDPGPHTVTCSITQAKHEVVITQ